MSLLTDLKNNSINTLANITDAAFEGDPSGTLANDSYFQSNVHNYLKALGIVATPNNTLFVSPGFSDLAPTHFVNPEDAFEQIKTDGSGVNNKKVILLFPTINTYNQNLTLDHNGYVVFESVSREAAVISGDITITTGTYVFKNIYFTGDIEISGATVIFDNCKNIGVDTTINGDSTVQISNCDTWSPIYVKNNDNRLFIEKVNHILKDGSDESIDLEVGMTGGVYLIRDSRAAGTLVEGTAADDKTNFIENDTYTRPSF